MPSQRKRNQLDELSNEFNSLAISTNEFHLHKTLDLKYSEQERKGYVHDTAKAIVKIESFPYKELLILFYRRHLSLIDSDIDFEDVNQKLQPIIQELIDGTYNPNYRMKTELSAESLGIDPDELQKFIKDLSKSKFKLSF